MPTLIYPRGARSWANGGTDPVATGTITATSVPAAGRITLDIIWTGALYLNVYRLQNGVPMPVRGAFPVGSTGSITISDPEAPLDIPVSYQVSSPNYPYQQIASSAVTLDSGGHSWLTHPLRPELSTKVMVQRNPAKERGIDQAVFPVIGRRRPVVVTAGVRRSPIYTLDAFTKTEDERHTMLCLLGDGAPLLFRAPAGYGFDPQAWLSVGPVQETPITGYVRKWARRWPLPCIEVDAPSVVDAPVVV